MQFMKIKKKTGKKKKLNAVFVIIYSGFYGGDNEGFFNFISHVTSAALSTRDDNG